MPKKAKDRTFEHYLYSLTQCLNLNYDMRYYRKLELVKHTFMASVWIVAITSSDPPKTWLSSWDRSYSQIEVAFSMTAILVMSFITSMFPEVDYMNQTAKYKLIIQRVNSKIRNKCIYCNCCSLQDHFGKPQILWIFAMVAQVVSFLLVLSRVVV